MKSRVIGTWISVIGLMLIGLWLRMRHLGDLSLVADEGIQALAVRGILEHGIPRLPSGELYLRSSLFLYAQSLCVRLFGLEPFGLRLPSVLFGVGVIPATYVLGRTLFDRSTGLLAAAIIALSVWEIEVSRFARFYTAFQLTFLLSALCFFRGFLREEKLYKFLFLASALVSIPTHRLSLLLAPLFLLPWLLGSFSWRRRLASLPWLAGLVLLILYERRVIRWLITPTVEASNGAVESGGAPAVSSDSGVEIWLSLRRMFRLPGAASPDFSLLDLVGSAAPWAVTGLAAVVALLAGTALYLMVRSPAKVGIWRTLLLVLIFSCAFLHQFGLVLILLAVYLLLFARGYSELVTPPMVVTLLGVTLSFVFWIAASQLLELGLPGREIAIALLGYPAFGGYFLSWYFHGWPVLTIGLAAGSFMLLTRFMRQRTDEVALFLLAAIYLLAVAASLFSSYREARYTFHFHTFIVVVFAFVVVTAGRYLLSRSSLAPSMRRAAVAAGLLALLLLNGDANVLEAWQVGARDYSSPKRATRSVLSWAPYADFHQDFESPGRFVAENRQPGEIVIAFGAVHMTALHYYYAGGLDYVVTPAGDPVYYAINQDGVIVNYITATPNLAGVAVLETLLRHHDGGVWLLADRRLLVDGNPFYGDAEKAFLRPLASRPNFLARDGETFAVRLGEN